MGFYTEKVKSRSEVFKKVSETYSVISEREVICESFRSPVILTLNTPHIFLEFHHSPRDFRVHRSSTVLFAPIL